MRSGIIGTAVGIIPGVGEDIGAWISYAAARRASKEKDLFTKGSREGLCAAGVADCPVCGSGSMTRSGCSGCGSSLS